MQSKQFSQQERNKIASCLVIILLSICLLLSVYSFSYNIATLREQYEQCLASSSFSSEQLKATQEEPEIESQEEDIINIGIICGGFNSTRNFYVLLKSILFQYQDKLSLHILVDDISKTILDELFRTWTLENVETKYYNISAYEQQVSFISSRHYSNKFGLMKLIFMNILANETTLNRMIILDTDMLVLGNIKHAWNEFKSLTISKSIDELPIFGMVENQSDWYLGNSKKLSGNSNIWPALGKGFNSGLMLVNLEQVREQYWANLWRDVAESELISHLSAPLADQDIFNAVIRVDNSIVYKLPCSFNLQLNDHTDLSEVCPGGKDQPLQIIHWNSPSKFLTSNREANLYMKWYKTFKNWDGKLLETNEQPESRSKVNLTKLDLACQNIKPRPEQKLRTFLYAQEFELEPTNFDITYVVHLSLDRIQVLDQVAMHWDGPISVAIYLPEAETNLFYESVENSENLLNRKNIGYHLVFRDYGFNYPINRLRNIALNNSITPFVYLSDIDFLPSLNLYSYLKQTIKELGKLDKKALVVPAFENLQYKFNFPASKTDLLTQLNLGHISLFREQIWPQGHTPTDYNKWRVSSRMYKVDWKPDYEPFIVTDRNVARFDERFIGFGWNKVEHITQLSVLGYEFIVLPEAFMIHKIHSASFDILQHRQSAKYRQCLKLLRTQFMRELYDGQSEKRETRTGNADGVGLKPSK